MSNFFWGSNATLYTHNCPIFAQENAAVAPGARRSSQETIGGGYRRRIFPPHQSWNFILFDHSNAWGLGPQINLA